MKNVHIDNVLHSAASAALGGHYTWQAICDSCETEGERLVILYTFRGVFQSQTPWPDNDFETRCLAFLMLNEFLNNP